MVVKLRIVKFGHDRGVGRVGCRGSWSGFALERRGLLCLWMLWRMADASIGRQWSSPLECTWILGFSRT